MSRTVNRRLIDQWIEDNAPNGLAALSVRSRVSPSTIAEARRGKAPKKDRTREKLCEALNVAEDDLFPPVSAGGGESQSA